MKRRCFAFALILLLVLSLGAPALALVNYGSIRDATDCLGSAALRRQGEQVLPKISERLGLDLRVDVLTESAYGSVGDTAIEYYEEYNYGYGERKEGATLTILLELQDGVGYAMPSPDSWCVYVNLRPGRGNSQDLANAIRDAVEPYMAASLWDGSDIVASSEALVDAAGAMAKAASDYVLANCPLDPAEAGSSPFGGNMQYVMDLAGYLTSEEWESLESKAKALSESHQMGIYFIIVDDYTRYGTGDVYTVTTQIYHNKKLGAGAGRDGIIVLLSMAERDYAMFVYGKHAEYAFDAYGQEQLEEAFLGDFGSNDWYTGISNYLHTCDDFLTKAEAGKPVRDSPWPLIGIMTALSCVVAGAVCYSSLRKMKTVHSKAEADAYLTGSGLHLTKQYDRYTHTTQTRTKIESKSSSSGGTSSAVGGGGSGRSGKF